VPKMFPSPIVPSQALLWEREVRGRQKIQDNEGNQRMSLAFVRKTLGPGN